MVAQILTGIEGGLISSYLIMVKGFSTPEAVAIVTTMMIPVMIIQVIGIYYLLEKLKLFKKVMI